MRRYRITSCGRKNTNTYKTRNGKVGDYINYLSPADIEKIESIIKQSEN